MKTLQTRRRTGPIGRKAQAGFGMAIALAVLAVFALIAGAIALANKGGNTKTDLETAKAMATSVVNRGNELLQAAQRVGQDRDLSKMLFDASAPVAATSTFGLYSPLIGVAVDVPIPGKAFAVTGSDVSFGPGTGYTTASGGVAIAAILPGLNEATCRLINKTVFNLSVDSVIPADQTANLGRAEGCVGTSSLYTYYKVLGAAA